MFLVEECVPLWLFDGLLLREFGTAIYPGEVDVDFAQAMELGYSWGRMNRQIMTYFSSILFVFSISDVKCYCIKSRGKSRDGGVIELNPRRGKRG